MKTVGQSLFFLHHTGVEPSEVSDEVPVSCVLCEEGCLLTGGKLSQLLILHTKISFRIHGPLAVFSRTKSVESPRLSISENPPILAVSADIYCMKKFPLPPSLENKRYHCYPLSINQLSNVPLSPCFMRDKRFNAIGRGRTFNNNSAVLYVALQSTLYQRCQGTCYYCR